MPEPQSTSPRLWPKWAMLMVFTFMAFECTLLGVALKGPWFILLAPGGVCGMKAWTAWRDLRTHLHLNETTDKHG